MKYLNVHLSKRILTKIKNNLTALMENDMSGTDRKLRNKIKRLEEEIKQLKEEARVKENLNKLLECKKDVIFADRYTFGNKLVKGIYKYFIDNQIRDLDSAIRSYLYTASETIRKSWKFDELLKTISINIFEYYTVSKDGYYFSMKKKSDTPHLAEFIEHIYGSGTPYFKHTVDVMSKVFDNIANTQKTSFTLKNYQSPTSFDFYTTDDVMSVLNKNDCFYKISEFEHGVNYQIHRDELLGLLVMCSDRTPVLNGIVYWLIMIDKSLNADMRRIKFTVWKYEPEESVE